MLVGAVVLELRSTSLWSRSIETVYNQTRQTSEEATVLVVTSLHPTESLSVEQQHEGAAENKKATRDVVDMCYYHRILTLDVTDR